MLPSSKRKLPRPNKSLLTGSLIYLVGAAAVHGVRCYGHLLEFVQVGYLDER